MDHQRQRLVKCWRSPWVEDCKYTVYVPEYAKGAFFAYVCVASREWQLW